MMGVGELIRVRGEIRGRLITSVLAEEAWGMRSLVDPVNDIMERVDVEVVRRIAIVCLRATYKGMRKKQ